MNAEQTTQQILQRYFLENRSRLLDIAAFLDRLDRATTAGPERQDFRLVAFKKALAELLSSPTGRVDRVQVLLSDPSIEPLESAAKSQGAFGASPHSCC